MTAISVLLGTALVLLQSDPFLRGLSVGLVLAITVAEIGFLVVLVGGTAPLMMGEVAEQWTAQSLRPLQRHGWHLANHVLLNNGDADHVLIGPGGVFVIETKWRREAWRIEGTDFDRDAAIAQVKQAAASVKTRLGEQVHVEPVVSVWTGAASSRSAPDVEKRYGDVVIVPGPVLESWALRRGRAVLDEETIARLWATLKQQKLRNVDFERANRPIPTSFDNLVLAACGLVLLAVLGLLASGWLFTTTKSFPLWLCGAGVVVVAYSFARRSAPLRRPGLAFTLGWGASLVFVAGIVVRELLT